MTVQDNVQSLIRELEQILWQDRLKDHPEVSILLEKIRHHLLMGQSTLNNHDAPQVEQLTEMVLHRLEKTLGNHILPLEVQQLHEQRDALLKEIANLQQQKQGIVSNFSQDLSTQKTVSLENSLDINPVKTSIDQQFQPLLEKLHLYSDSLEEGIERMYQLGQQGETKFLAYLNRLQEKLALFLQEDTENKNLTNDSWYVGFELEDNQIKGCLFTFLSSSRSLRKLKTYCLSELLKLCKIELFDHENLLDNIKEHLTAFNQIIALSSVTFHEQIPLKNIIEKIEKIVLIGSSKWTEKDRNILKTIIREHLKLSQSKEIIWIPKPLALTLSYIPKNTAKITSLACVINLTQNTTELSIVEPSQGTSGIITQQLFYGTQGIDQDILCQLIYPQWAEKISLTFPPLPQPFPTPGLAEIAKRKALKEHLEDNNLGNTFMEAAQLTRFILQQQDQFTSTLAQKSWSVNRKEIIKKVLNPWIITIHKKLELLLSQSHYSSDSIAYTIVPGADLNSLDYALFPWLTEIFPNARIIEAEEKVQKGKLFSGLQNFLADIKPDL